MTVRVLKKTGIISVLILLLFMGANPEHLPEWSKTIDCREEGNTGYHECKDPEPS